MTSSLQYSIPTSFSSLHGKTKVTSGAPKDGFLLNALKSLFRLSGALLDLQKCNLSGAIKFASIRSS